MYKRGGSWYSDFRYGGERYQRSWGVVPKTLAKELEYNFRTEVVKGTIDNRPRKVLFETLAEKYIENAQLNKKPSSARRNATSIKMLMPHFQAKLVGAIHQSGFISIAGQTSGLPPVQKTNTGD